MYYIATARFSDLEETSTHLHLQKKSIINLFRTQSLLMLYVYTAYIYVYIYINIYGTIYIIATTLILR